MSDSEVKGLQRLIPTALSQVLLGTLLIAIIPGFWFLYTELIPVLLPHWQAREQLLLACLLISLFSIVILLIVLIDLAMLIDKKKHSVIRFLNNQHPYMSTKWLIANATYPHYFFIALFAVVIFISGLYTGKT